MLYMMTPTRTDPESISALDINSLTKSLIFWKFASVTLVEASKIIARSVFPRPQPVKIVKDEIISGLSTGVQ